MDKPLLVIDTETTGLHPESNDVLQIAVVVVSTRYLTKVEKRKWDVRLDNPFAVLSEEYRRAQKVHGISTRRALLGGLRLDEVVDELKEYPYRYPGALVAGDNVGFDYAFLKQMFERTERKNPFDYHLVDLTGLAAVHLGVVGLKNIAEKLGLDSSRYTKHDALGDAELTADCFIALIKMLRSKEELMAKIAESAKRVAGDVGKAIEILDKVSPPS